MDNAVGMLSEGISFNALVYIMITLLLLTCCCMSCLIYKLVKRCREKGQAANEDVQLHDLNDMQYDKQASVDPSINCSSPAKVSNQIEFFTDVKGNRGGIYQANVG